MDAALGLLDSAGLDSVTMRGVADRLGTGPASLYAHFADKDEMVAAVLDRVLSEVRLPSKIDKSRWQDQLKALVIDGRSAFARHRDIARASLGNVPTGEGALPLMDMMVGILLAGGVSPRVAAYSVDILALYLTASAFEDSLDGFQKHGGPTGDPSADFHDELKGFLGSLPADRFPHLVSLAGPLTAGDNDERFEFGVDLLIRGIASTVSPSRKRR